MLRGTVHLGCDGAPRRFRRVRFRTLVLLAGSAALGALVVVEILLYRSDPRWAAAGLAGVSGLMEISGVSLVVLEGSDRRRTIQAYLENRRQSPSVRPLSTSEPFHPQAPGGYSPSSRAPLTSDLTALQARVASRVNRVVEDMNRASTRADRGIEEFVVALTAGNRGRTRLSIVLLVGGIVFATVANLWSLLWLG